MLTVRTVPPCSIRDGNGTSEPGRGPLFGHMEGQGTGGGRLVEKIEGTPPDGGQREVEPIRIPSGPFGVDLQNATGIGHEIGDIDDAPVRQGLRAGTCGQDIVGRTDNQPAAELIDRVVAQDTRRGAGCEDIAGACMRILGGHHDAAHTLRHRVGAAGIHVGHADESTPVGEKARQARSDVPGPLHGHPHVREVVAQRMADRGGDGMEHPEGGRW